MLTCLPRFLCSWDFRVEGASVEPATVEFDFLLEKGTIRLGSNVMRVTKHGIFSGRWTLDLGAETVATAEKPNSFFRSFEVLVDGKSLTVEAQNPFGRAFDIRVRGETIGTIYPAHGFTRRAFVECRPEVSEAAQLFCFWLAALTWRRAANSQAQ